jgi:hypothetical protein
MYMKSLSVRQNKLLTQQAITTWFEYLHKHSPRDTVCFISIVPWVCPTLININEQVWAIIGMLYIILLPFIDVHAMPVIADLEGGAISDLANDATAYAQRDCLVRYPPPLPYLSCNCHLSTSRR